MKTIDSNPETQEAFIKLAFDLAPLLPFMSQDGAVSLCEKIFKEHIQGLRTALTVTQVDLQNALNENDALKAKLATAVSMSVSLIENLEKQSTDRIKAISERKSRLSEQKKEFKNLLK